MKKYFILLLCISARLISIGQIPDRPDIDFAIQGKFAKAVKAIDKTIDKDPVNSQYHIAKADYQLQLKEYEGAVKTLSHAMELMPDSFELFNMMGVLSESFKMNEMAIMYFGLAYSKAAKNTDKAAVLVNRGGTKLKMRNFQGSYDDLIIARRLDSTNIDVLNNLAAVSDKVGHENETLGYIMAILEIDSNYVPAYINLGFKYQALNRHKEAINFFDRAVKLAPFEALAYSNRAYSKLKTEDIEGAKKDINKSIELFSTNSYAYKIRALIHVENANKKKACEDLHTATQLGYRKQFGEEVDELIKTHCQE